MHNKPNEYAGFLWADFDIGWCMDLRELRGLELAARTRVVFEDGVWRVPSQSGGGKYMVKLSPDSCTCEDFQLRQEVCKHIHAARLTQERDHGGKATVIDTSAVPKRPTYPQNWEAYNEAQHHEKHRLQVLLHELCKGLPAAPYKGTGRRPTPLADVIFAVVFKVYSTFSSRRFGSDLSDAHVKGYLASPMHPNKVNTHLENPDLFLLLKGLIEQSALPLRTIETAFAPDSSGFSTSKFVRWFDEKYGVHREGHEWVKVHLICGVQTNVVTAVEILDKNAADCPQFKPLVEKTAENCTVKEVPADKAYLSRDNLELVASLGGTAYVPFKINSIGDGGGIWEKMFHFFSFNRQEFLTKYHKRSNVESTFSMVKRKFGDSLRSRSDAAMKNEVLCKILCHNLCCLILAQCELGIEAVFWQNEPKAEAAGDVLPMVKPG